MPTPKKGPRLASSPAHERLMLANMATSLFQNGRITTTLPKAKRLRPLAERLITLAKRGDLHNRRRVMRVIRNKSVVHKLFTEIAEQMEQREGGYTRIVKIAPRRGDAAPAAIIELVTEPDLRTPEEARAFMQKLRQIYLTLGISDCSMEEGSLRADGNVSLRRRGSTELGTKTELKNINSFKNLHDGLAYEICRQAEVLESGGVIRQETRHWEPGAKRTIVMRVKETADDYRMFPDPDLAPFDLSDEFIENVRAKLPELPDAKKARFMESYGLPAYDAGELAGDVEVAQFFEEAAQDADAIVAKKIANLIINDVSAWANENATSISASKITPAALAALAKMLADDTISSKQGKEVLAALIGEGIDPEEYVKSHGMEQTTDTGAIETIVDELMAANPDKVEAYRGGKTGLQGFFMGQVMKQLGGQGNPKVISAIVTEKLEG